MFETIEQALVDWFKAAGVGVYLDGRGQHWRAEINGTDLSLSELAAAVGAKLPAALCETRIP